MVNGVVGWCLNNFTKSAVSRAQTGQRATSDGKAFPRTSIFDSVYKCPKFARAAWTSHLQIVQATYVIQI
jgi:hypothetical protein